MTERESEAYGSYEPEPGDEYEWDYEEQERGPRVLWGRVAILTGVIVLAFFLGRASSPSGVPEERIDRLRAQLSDARAEAERLRDRPQSVVTVTPAPEETAAEEETTASERTYTVKSGDTLQAIAQRFYGDAALDDCLAVANDIDDPADVPAGATLTIPPEEDCV